MRILTSEQMKKVELYAFENGLAYSRMMENAGSASAKIIINEVLGSKTDVTVAVVCGKGNNAGDGFVIARKLFEYGCKVTVILALGNPNSEDSILMFDRLRDISVKVIDCRYDSANAEKTLKNSDIIIDAVFGFGFTGSISGELERLINIMSESKGYKIAIDIPSGISANCGEITSAHFSADLTIAISSLKVAHVMLPAALASGKVKIAEIGIDEACYDVLKQGGIYTLSLADIKGNINKRNPVSHKGDYGHLLNICGSRNYQGAAVLAALGAINSGVGLVTAAFPDCAYSAIGAKLTEPVLLPLNSNQQGMISISAIPKLRSAIKNADAVLIGCGLGLSSDTKEIVSNVLQYSKCPIILDADGINAIVGNIDILKAASAPVILTPHPGEMSALTGLSIDYIQKNRSKVAKAFADNYGVMLVLKGANTVVASPDNSKVYINPTGNPGMAVGGSGDLLAGIMASFVAQGMSCQAAAVSAVFIHGMAGDEVAQKYSQRGLTPSLCANHLPLLLSKFE